MKRWFIILLILVLASLSLISLQSIAPNLVNKQAVFYGLGMMVFLVLSRSRFNHWQRLSLIGYIGLNLLLLGLLIFGQSTRGTTGWIELFGGYKFQPSQFAVFWSGLFVAFQLKESKISNLKSFTKIVLIMSLPGLLILAEPDIGTALVYFLSLSVVFILMKPPLKFLLGLGLMGLLAGAVMWQFGLNQQRKQRLTSFFGGYEEQEDAASYNARQALIAVGSGQLYGRGLGFGIQSHLKFLPERQTDFIFASIAEEWGFVGSSLIVLIYGALCCFLVYLVNKMEQVHYQVFILTQLMMFLVQIGINIGMNLGLVPITGITLPLLSYGGSSLLAVLFSLGLIQALTKELEPVKWKLIS